MATTTSKRWYPFGTIGDYETFQDWDGLFNIARKGEEPGQNDGGYHDLDALLKLKGLDPRNHVTNLT